MDAVAAAGVVGRTNNTPESLPPGSDVANLCLLGYNPLECFTGRAAIEAAAQGIELGPDDWAVRCNLVTVEDQTMKSFTAGQISTPEAGQLIETLQGQLGDETNSFLSFSSRPPACTPAPPRHTSGSIAGSITGIC